jgi:putative Holliday junction resolvase
MKILALDIGDIWTGSAISDPLCMFARPYQTIKTESLESFLETVLKQEHISTVIIGYPKTMRGTCSVQTKKVETIKNTLKHKFDTLSLILWDERLSSKRAEKVTKRKTSEDKRKSHAVAAAFILASYLDYLNAHKQN